MMQVEVIRLRVDGKKLTQDQLKSMPRALGFLLFTGFTIGDQGLTYEASLKSSVGRGGSSVIPDLHRACVRKIELPNIMISGVEYHGGFKPENEIPQAWWCVVIGK